MEPAPSHPQQNEPSPIEAFLDGGGVLVLDGGLATELEALGCDLDDELWSARVLIEEPELIRRVHRRYLEAGADCIISASYQATIEGFGKRGLSVAEAEEMLSRAVALAVEERDAFWAAEGDPEPRSSGRLRPLVAASVGPYGAFLADGSEFTGDYDLDEDGLFEFHRRRWHLLAASGADLLACETLPSAAEARALVRLLRDTPWVSAWFSFSCRDGTSISDGTPLAHVVRALDPEPRIVAVGINCTAPRYIGDLVSKARAVTAKPIVAYPNSGEAFDAASKSWSAAADAVDPVELAPEWRRAGARLIGGCCRTGPDYIRRLRARLAGAAGTE